MGFFIVLKAELVRMFIIMRRYWFASLVGIIIGYGILITIVFAFMTNRDAVQKAAGAWADSAVNGSLGFIAGIFAFGLVGMFSQGLQSMMRSGELEQLCMSPYGLITNFLARSFVMAANSILSLAIMLALVTTTVQGKLHFEPLLTILIFSLTYINLIGFGFMMGGLILVFKQVGQIAVLVRLAMIGIATMATTQDLSAWPTVPRVMAHALPITDAAICMKYTLVDGQERPVVDEAGKKILLEQVPLLDSEGAPVLDEAGNAVVVPVFQMERRSVLLHPSFWLLIMSCAIWTPLGIFVFRVMENHSRYKGTLGAY